MYLQSAVNWPNQSTLHVIMHHLKILFYEILQDLDLVTTAPPWYSLEQPKPLYENDKGKAYWDVPVFAENFEVINNRITQELSQQGEEEGVPIGDELSLDRQGEERREDN